MSYSATHASALRSVTSKGSAVTFTTTDPGTYDATADTFASASSSTVAGYAIQVGGNPLTYQALSLVQGQAPSLFFVPSTFGNLPAIGDAVTWASDTYVVKDVQPLQPDGTAIAATVVIAR